MKILFLNDFIPPRHIGGPGKRNFELALEFNRLGHEVYFITSCQGRSFTGEETKDGIKVFNIYSKYPSQLRDYLSIFNPFIIRKLEKIVKKISPDVVHADIIHTHISYASLKIAKKYSKAVFLTSRDFMLFNYGKFLQKERKCGEIKYKIGWRDNFSKAGFKYNPFRNFFIKRYLKYVDKIFTVSNELTKALNQNGILNTQTIHNGLPFIENKDTEESNKDLRPKTVLFAGRVSLEKGSRALVDSFVLVKKKIADAKLIMIGVSKEGEKSILNYAKKIGVDDIEILPWINEEKIREFFKSSSVIVSPSLYPDPFPGVNLEAAFYKKPVVTTCFGGAKEFILDGQTGYVVNPYNKEELANRIAELLIDEQKAKIFGEKSFSRLRNDFSVQKQAEKILIWYKKFID